MRLKERIKNILNSDYYEKQMNHLKDTIQYLQDTVDCQERTIRTMDDIICMKKERCDTQSIELKQAQAKQNQLQDEINRLKLLIPSEFPIDRIMNDCADAAWYGYENKINKTFESLDGTIKLHFHGTVYEPSYEYFTAGCNVYYQESGSEKLTPLYTIDSRNVDAYRNEAVETGSVNLIREYLIQKNLGFKEVSAA